MERIKLKLITDERYGNDARAINRHHVKIYQDADGNRYNLGKTLDGIPPFYDCSGPYRQNYCGVLPRIRIDGQEYWGTGLTWKKATEKFLAALNAEIRSPYQETKQ